MGWESVDWMHLQLTANESVRTLMCICTRTGMIYASDAKFDKFSVDCVVENE